jgi:hypothetical protein
MMRFQSARSKFSKVEKRGSSFDLNNSQYRIIKEYPIMEMGENPNSSLRSNPWI